MRPVLTHRLIPVNDSQHAVMLIDMLNQFTHGGTISAPTDNPARRGPEASDPHHRTSRRMQHARRSASRTVPRRATCSIAAQGHPHTASAGTKHSCAMSLLQAGVDTTVIALWLGHASVRSTDAYVHTDMTIKEQALAPTTPVTAQPGRYRPSGKVLAFLNRL
ncbi:tyrosine-type recombinase/integrase [Streptomyces populi]|uniref:tyrosine-type recombinase/integrase n=1 Tax=Streptomyces populi TaxID=2058924 RepID=UPI0035DE388F